MSTEIATYQPGSLAVSAEQEAFTEKQRKALEHIGVENASDGDLQVFFHVCQRTGLDPFARQIYMIGRKSGERQPDGSWVDVVKQTIQTGIDGFRLIGRRAADQRRETISVHAPEWAKDDGTWRPVWVKAWGEPVAARVTILRNGEPFTAVALFDEYKQTKRNGDLTQMWGQRPAGQLAKCAEALAWRMAFPQDLSGIYVEDEMHQAENRPAGPERMEAGARIADVIRAEQVEAEVAEEPETPSPLLNTRSNLAKRLYATIGQAGIPETQRVAFIATAIGRPIESSKEMTEAEAQEALDNFDALLAAWMTDATGGAA